MTNRSILPVLLAISILLKSCMLDPKTSKVCQIKRKFKLCFPQKNTWKKPVPTYAFNTKDIAEILTAAKVVSSNECFKIYDVKLDGKPMLFSERNVQQATKMNGVLIEVSCKVDASKGCLPSKNAIELILPQVGAFAHKTNTFPKELDESSTNMSHVVLSQHWDLPESWDFALQLDVVKVEQSGKVSIH